MNDDTVISLKPYSKLFFAVFGSLILLSIAATYYRYVILEDFEVFIEFNEAGEVIIIEE